MLISTHLLSRIVFFSLAVSITILAQDAELNGDLSVELKQDGYVYLNSDLIANESFQNLKLYPGNYTLSVYNSDSRKWSQRGYEKEITINSGEQVQVTIEYAENFYINSLPFDADILFDGKIIGTTPTFINSNLIKEKGYISLKKDGYKESDIPILPEKYSYFARLDAKPGNSQIKPVLVQLNNSQTSWLKEGLIVTSLVSSWGAFYFKREADKNFDKYMNQGNPGQIAKYYDRTKRFDTYSDISITISVAAIGTYMYFLIFD